MEQGLALENSGHVSRVGFRLHGRLLAASGASIDLPWAAEVEETTGVWGGGIDGGDIHVF